MANILSGTAPVTPADLQAETMPEAVLEVVQADGSRESVRINRWPFRVGVNRAGEQGNDLDLGSLDRRVSGKVSRKSVRLVCANGEVRLEDIGQRQGVFVNGEKTEGCALHDGDVIKLGAADALKLIFHGGQPGADTLPGLLSRLENAAAAESGTRDLRQLNVLLEATALLQARLPISEVLAAMIDRAIDITDADRGLLLQGSQQDHLRPLIARQKGGHELPVASIKPSQTVMRQALEQQGGIKGLSEAIEAKDAESVVIDHIRNVVAIPLFSTQFRWGESSTTDSRQMLGMLYLDSQRDAAFSHLQRRILDALAVEAASVLDNARLIERERERRGLERELSIAREIQQALLPKNFKRYARCEAIGINRPCFAVGGDYFDFMDAGGERVAFMIADVSGKGLGAALLTTMLQFGFSNIAFGQAAAVVFQNVNRFICTHCELNRHATMFFGMLHAAGQLEFINAGHVPAILIRDSRAQTVCSAGALPVGLLGRAEFTAEIMALDPGDTLVLFTDGITEAVDPAGEMFGMERLLQAAEHYAGKPVEELQAAILADVARFSRGACQGDDMTMLIIRYLGPPQ